MYRFEFAQYRNGNIAVQVFDEEGPYARLSVNVPGVTLEKGEFVLNHDLNRPRLQSFLQKMLNSGKFEDTGKVCHYGFVTNQPIWRMINE